MSVLSVRNLTLCVAEKTLVQQVNLTVDAGQCVALVGESGSGKSLTALACARLLPDAIRVVAGDVVLNNTTPVFDLPRRALSSIRGKRIGMVFQEPSLALNPVLTVGEQLMEALQLHTLARGQILRQAAIHAMHEVGIEHAAQRLNDYPMQFSGGQKQRVMIAMALAGKPDLLIADEPTTALDVLVQAQVLGVLKQLSVARGMALLLITHDLAIVKQMADAVVVMQAGRVVESALASDFFAAPKHPHSRALLAANRGHVWVAGANPDAKPILQVQGLSAHYQTRSAWWRKPQRSNVLHDLALVIAQGETLALVGASGSGKTTLAKVILGLQDHQLQAVGTLKLDTRTVDAPFKPDKAWQQSVSVVFQDPFASLNPRMRAGDIVLEGVRNLRPEWSLEQAQQQIAELMAAVDLPADSLLRWPHEFSGGQRQRLAIVRALAVAPKLVLLDEPTSALDVTVQAKLLDLLVQLQRRFGYSYLLITHHFHVVQALAQHVAVLHEGRVVECGATAQVLQSPQHAQTLRLLNAVPHA